VLPLYASENTRHTDRHIGISISQHVPFLYALKTLAYRHIGISAYRLVDILGTVPLRPLKNTGIPAYRHIGISMSQHCSCLYASQNTGIPAYRYRLVIDHLASTPLKHSAYRHIGISAYDESSTLLSLYLCKHRTAHGISMSREHRLSPYASANTRHTGISAYRIIINTVPMAHEKRTKTPTTFSLLVISG
jgi:hypothetical protein